MDSIDDEIIDVLRDDARASFSAIGRQVGLSTNATAARVRRLERAGVILGYRVVLGENSDEDIHRAGLEAFVDVRLDPARNSEDFLEWARRLPEIGDAVHVTGAYDYLLHVRVGDTGALDRLLRTLKNDGGATHTQTRLALR
ncbi:Lrp/AsnC family transcriptional regulator [Herbiconiux liangxiaofengii]|uniref:Lrp/AsnC family transcriptional regulator n=1 Tax=Herbiconiux liangxiaofengii TaxID=3342795 RepID=UPI0035B8AFF3